MTSSDEALLLADAVEVRLSRSPAEAKRQLAGGFRPSVVLLDVRGETRGDALVRRVTSDPSYSAIPVMGISGDGERLRCTLMNDVGAFSSLAHLRELLRILEKLCLDLPAAGFPDALEPVTPSAPQPGRPPRGAPR